MDFAVAASVRYKIDNLRNHMHRIAREERLEKAPTSDIYESGRSYERGGGTQARKNRHAQHAVRNWFSKWASSCEIRIDVQSVAIPGQFSELADILE